MTVSTFTTCCIGKTKAVLASCREAAVVKQLERLLRAGVGQRLGTEQRVLLKHKYSSSLDSEHSLSNLSQYSTVEKCIGNYPKDTD